MLKSSDIPKSAGGEPGGECFHEVTVSGLWCAWCGYIQSRSFREGYAKNMGYGKDRIAYIYSDGGLVGKNPSKIGGTWAWCGVTAHGVRVVESSGFTPAPEGIPITNNHMEQIALTLALEYLPKGWSGTACSDSRIALGRVFDNFTKNNLPKNISDRSKMVVSRLGKIHTVNIEGHPNEKALKTGIGTRRGLPVSWHNKWCDLAAQEARQLALA